MSWSYGRTRRKKPQAHQPQVNYKVNESGFGDVEFVWKDGGTPGCKFNRIAHSGRSELLMISVIAETQRVKQIRAALVPSQKKGGNGLSIIAGGVKTNVPGYEEWHERTPGRLNPSAEGYYCYQHKLGYGLAHALFVTKTPGFMLVMSEESLWRELKSDRFTTPLLREWMPYLDTQLRENNRLEDAHCYDCHCGILSVTTAKLDEIVLDGLKTGQIWIPKEQLASASA
jgi:hypothetical protein